MLLAQEIESQRMNLFQTLSILSHEYCFSGVISSGKSLIAEVGGVFKGRQEEKKVEGSQN